MAPTARMLLLVRRGAKGRDRARAFQRALSSLCRARCAEPTPPALPLPPTCLSWMQWIAPWANTFSTASSSAVGGRAGGRSRRPSAKGATGEGAAHELPGCSSPARRCCRGAAAWCLQRSRPGGLALLAWSHPQLPPNNPTAPTSNPLVPPKRSLGTPPAPLPAPAHPPARPPAHEPARPPARPPTREGDEAKPARPLVLMVVHHHSIVHLRTARWRSALSPSRLQPCCLPHAHLLASRPSATAPGKPLPPRSAGATAAAAAPPRLAPPPSPSLPAPSALPAALQHTLLPGLPVALQHTLLPGLPPRRSAHRPHPPPSPRITSPSTHLPKLPKVGAEGLVVHGGRQPPHKDLLGALPVGHRLLVLADRALVLGQRALGLHLRAHATPRMLSTLRRPPPGRLLQARCPASPPPQLLRLLGMQAARQKPPAGAPCAAPTSTSCSPLAAAPCAAPPPSCREAGGLGPARPGAPLAGLSCAAGL